ncbi:ATPase [Siculibacillus lacustris]|uniref:ATPase n=1 Tax=Siculibacillus lacustris TaxID=1549641 RepID=A0A4Q9VUH9_9HYPH|nr:SRPBCC family protein [Siculibacillus lacustris]TBW39815.1 ATPase [Siculibacillus lacustris]
MTESPRSSFVYVTYIRTTPERLWSALVSPEFAEQYWLGARPEADWKVGGAWKLVLPDGRVADTGEITEFDPPKRLAIRWRNEFMPELKAEGWSLCTMDLEAGDAAVKLTVTHAIDRADSRLIGAVSGGWPQILSNLKTLLETGSVLLPPKYLRAS